MFFEGNWTETLQALNEKKWRLTNNRSHGHIRILLVICGGVLKGVYGGGAVTALHERGFGAVFDWLFGSSTGGPTACYTMSGKPWLGTSIYWEECCTRSFIDKRKLFGTPCDIAYIMNVFRYSPLKRMDPKAIFRHRSELILPITDAETGEQKFIRPKTADDLFRVLQATIAVPGSSNGLIEIGDRLYGDGSYSGPLPVERLISELDPTHVLVIANREQKICSNISLPELVLNETIWRNKMGSAFRKAARNRRRVMKAEVAWLRRECSIPWLIYWGDNGVGSTTQDPALLLDTAIRSRKFWNDFLGDPL